jgi:tetratricopeptide (TPR) repeat protein
MIMRGLAKLAYGGLPDASFEEAEKNFKKAIELNPNRVGNFVELGRTYFELGKKDLARTNMDKGLRLPSIYRDDEPTKARARKLLNDL